jgi:uncharacterized protein (TIGR03435 family)
MKYLARLMSGIAVVTLLAGAGRAANPPAFEVASIKPADPGETGPGDIPVNTDRSPGHFIMRNVPLRYCLQWAYDLRDYEISGPDWIKSENRYDIVANASGPASDNEMKQMLQTLLTERFQIVMHKETKILDVYALLPGKGTPKLKDPAPTDETSLAGSPAGLVFTKQPLSRLTFLLTRRMDRPVLDLTGIKGAYNFTLDVSGLGFNGNPAADTSAPSVFTTVQQDLGLRLQAQKSPVEVLVIDRAEKVPTAN